MYTNKGKRTLGQSLEELMTDQRTWPISLRDYFYSIPKDNRAKGLTYTILIKWMAKEAQIPQLAYEEYLDRFVKLIGRYKSWSHDPAQSAGDNMALLTAISRCGIIRDASGAVVKDADDLLGLLYGQSLCN